MGLRNLPRRRGNTRAFGLEQVRDAQFLRKRHSGESRGCSEQCGREKGMDRCDGPVELPGQELRSVQDVVITPGQLGFLAEVVLDRERGIRPDSGTS